MLLVSMMRAAICGQRLTHHPLILALEYQGNSG